MSLVKEHLSALAPERHGVLKFIWPRPAQARVAHMQRQLTEDGLMQRFTLQQLLGHSAQLSHLDSCVDMQILQWMTRGRRVTVVDTH